MKRTNIIIAVVALFAFVAAGATQFSRIVNLQVLGKTLLGSTTETNAITKALAGSKDFSAADAGANSCITLTTVTVTGAALGDPCMVGTELASESLQPFCRVTAADTASIYVCNPTAAPLAVADAGYDVRVISAQ